MHHRRVRLLRLPLVVALAVAALGCDAGRPQIPRSGLPDPIQAVQAGSLERLFDGRSPARPGCRLAESHTRCTWADTADSARRVQLTFYADTVRAAQLLARADAQPIELPLADQAAIVEQPAAVELWAIVGARGLQVTYEVGSTGDAAAQRAPLLEIAAQAAAGLAGAR
ncbi:MAG TPA: hypothetical protein VNT28_00830 [Candidatus Limnocylindrales bacterium]|nr:hypothetical protein [Candidatus Limnocylindrales bacterium]